MSYPKGDYVNSAIPTKYTSVSYVNIETVIHLVQRHGHNCLMAKSDIEDEFRLLPIHPYDHHLLGFTWEGKYYYDTCLSMGCSSSCQLFEKFSTALHWILKNRLGIVEISHLLDDFFFVGKANSQVCGYT